MLLKVIRIKVDKDDLVDEDHLVNCLQVWELLFCVYFENSHFTNVK